ncbi:unnamed protein product, partial [Prorocentrum cordatum]
VFHIKDHVFLGTRFAAMDRAIFDALEIKAVVNLTAGASRVPNRFEAWGVQYLHVELMDELVTDPSQAVPMGVAALRRWGEDGLNVLVHCQMGLSRSTLLVLAWLMRHAGLSLKAAAGLMVERRGRRPKCNPSFWFYLAALERELHGWGPCRSQRSRLGHVRVLLHSAQRNGLQEADGGPVHCAETAPGGAVADVRETLPSSRRDCSSPSAGRS